MRQYRASDIKAFLLALDDHLASPLYLEVIGSAAAMLAYQMDRDTKDFDTTVSIDAFVEAWKDTAIETGLDLPLDQVTVHQPPYEYESRLERLPIPELRMIQVFVPEKHDWALLKVSRLSDKDREHVLDVALRIGFNQDVLLERFQDEMWMAHGNKNDLIFNFLDLMEDLFGAEVARRMEARIARDPRWRS